MEERSNGYFPNRFTIKKDIPVRWVIDAKDPYSCASALVSSKLGVRKNLQAGKNIIEFTPKETGKIKFSCSMGMYSGYFDVIDGKSASEDSSSVPKQSNAGYSKNSQSIKTSYTVAGDIQPNTFTVKSGLPVRLSCGKGRRRRHERDHDPGLYKTPELLEKGKLSLWILPD